MGFCRGSAWVVALLLCGVWPAHAQLRSFQKPALNGYALSYCDSDGHRCGETVAKAWCQKRGYGYASEWQIERATGFSSQTVRLDDGSICRGTGCDGFSRITCGGRPHGHAYLMPSLGQLTPGAFTKAPAVGIEKGQPFFPGQCRDLAPRKDDHREATQQLGEIPNEGDGITLRRQLRT